MKPPKWIVNDLGELGVEVEGHCYFLYKGRSLEYQDGCHDDGTPMLYRPVGKREFGETCTAAASDGQPSCTTGRYTRELAFDPLLSQGAPADYAWRPLPRWRTDDAETP